MSLLDDIFAHAALRDAPPVLVDVGASGGIHPRWRRIARYAVAVGFEPDARERGALEGDRKRFRRWILCDKLVVAEPGRAEAELHLTKSPYCSSTLEPDAAGLHGWAFADLFTLQETRRVPATTLMAALQAHGLTGIDWLKCDTQGTDLRIFRGLPAALRANLLAAEFEPGLIDAYRGEDKLPAVLAELAAEPFWLARFEPQAAVRGGLPMLRARLGERWARRYVHLGPGAPGWANLAYLHTVTPALDLRGHLLLWVFATELEQPAFACELAEAGAVRFGDPLFTRLADESARQMRRALWRSWPKWFGLLAARFGSAER